MLVYELTKSCSNLCRGKKILKHLNFMKLNLLETSIKCFNQSKTTGYVISTHTHTGKPYFTANQNVVNTTTD